MLSQHAYRHWRRPP